MVAVYLQVSDLENVNNESAAILFVEQTLVGWTQAVKGIF